VRFPSITRYLDDTGIEQPVDWVAVDLDLIERYGVAFRSDWRQLRSSRRWLEQHRDLYVVQALNDGVAVLQRQGPIHPGLEKQLDRVLQRPLPLDPRKRKT